MFNAFPKEISEIFLRAIKESKQKATFMDGKLSAEKMKNSPKLVYVNQSISRTFKKLGSLF